ncbi:class I SAM-dependent methyltransferase [Streptomyces sp. SB3404]|uniref:Class I SAM-dependent methyltransferase n=2 Tax=Streptomyces boncukensis TaxID=2711219 RepID=A0A6G4X3C8_9ACTN|nr:class I SAM-dependent methyltransferase [Streptomyces boncukensis]NGO71888.1 class I SAM-dependent methyltransferase [Streptomyces boncukensis]
MSVPRSASNTTTAVSSNHTPLVDPTRFPAVADGEVRAAHRLYEHLIGIWAPGVIEAAQDLGAFAALTEGPATAAALAETLGTDLRATRVLLDGLSAYDVVQRTRGADGQAVYTLPAELHGVFAPDGLYSLAGKIGHDRNVAWSAWRNLARNVRDGARTSDGAEQLNQISEEDYTSLVRGINFWAPPIVRPLAERLRTTGWGTGSGRTLLDVGCGTGIYSHLLLKEFPELSATGLDVGRIVPIAEAQAAQLGVADRFRCVTGDFWNDEWTGDTDLALFVNIFHLQTPESARDLLLKSAKALSDDGVIAIADHIVDEEEGEDSTQNRFFRLFAASMLATGGGDAFTVHDYDQWLSDAGLRRVGLLDTPMHRVLLASHA